MRASLVHIVVSSQFFDLVKVSENLIRHYLSQIDAEDDGLHRVLNISINYIDENESFELIVTLVVENPGNVCNSIRKILSSITDINVNCEIIFENCEIHW